MSAHRQHAEQKVFIAVLLFSCAAIRALTGCASTDASKQIKAFSDATITTTSNVSRAFALVEDAHFQMEISEDVLNYSKSGFKPGTIQPFMSPAALQARIDILNGLKIYAANLSTLVGNAPLTNLDADTTKVGQALTSINTDLVKDSFFKSSAISSNDLQIFTAGINAIGHWIISAKQNAAAKQIIEQMQDPITSISKLLISDFQILGEQADKDLKDTLRSKDQYLVDNKAAFDNNPFEKDQEVQQLPFLEQRIKDESALFVLLQSSATNLAATHKVLGKVFSKDPSDAKSLISNFSTEAQRISKYYDSLSSTNK
jgi:hypothetical protein